MSKDGSEHGSAPVQGRLTLTQYRKNNPPIPAIGGSQPSITGAAAPRARGKQNQPDLLLQQGCVSWAEQHVLKFPALKMMFSPVNGTGRTKAEEGALKALGARKGVPKLIIPVANKSSSKPYAGLALFIKSPAENLSSEQEAWMRSLRKRGYLCAVVRKLEDFIEAVKEFHQKDEVVA